jgi:hypothetical protein
MFDHRSNIPLDEATFLAVALQLALASHCGRVEGEMFEKDVLRLAGMAWVEPKDRP